MWEFCPDGKCLFERVIIIVVVVVEFVIVDKTCCCPSWLPTKMMKYRFVLPSN